MIVSRSILLLLFLLAVSAPVAAPLAAQDADTTASRTTWTRHFIADYALAAGGLYLGMFADIPARRHSLIGPSFDPADPVAILVPAHAGTLGGRFVPEAEWALPNAWIIAAAAAHVVLIPAHELLASRAGGRAVSPRRLHHAVLAASEATAVTAGVVELTKALTGRLRPDFQDRVRHVYCSLPDHGGIDCTGIDPARLLDHAEALDALADGRRSFVSGHAAAGTVMATNLALHLGGHWVWGDAATPTTRRNGIAAMTVIMALGTVPGITRTSLVDGVHHTGDVVAGSLLGVAGGGLFYWLHFDTNGEPRAGHWLTRPRTRTALPFAPDGLHLLPGPDGMVLHATWRTR
jgi:membrane-associated phospholipid phosphatase